MLLGLIYAKDYQKYQYAPRVVFNGQLRRLPGYLQGQQQNQLARSTSVKTEESKKYNKHLNAQIDALLTKIMDKLCLQSIC